MRALWLCVVGVICGCVSDVETDGDGAGGASAFEDSDHEWTEQAAGENPCEPACVAGFDVFVSFCNSKHVPEGAKSQCWSATNEYTGACVKERAIPGCAPSCGRGYRVFTKFCEAFLNTKKCEKMSRLSASKCLAVGKGY